MLVVLLQQQQHLLSGSGKGYEVIGTDQPNLPAGARQYNGDIDWDDWDDRDDWDDWDE